MSKKRITIDKAKKWMSFSRLLHNDRLMMILSIVLAAAIWFGVISGPANIVTRSIPVTVTVDLGDTYVAKSGLRIVSESEFVVNVNVSGPWSAVSKLSDTDFRVRADLTTITGAGDINLPINVSRSGSISDYDIVSVSPATVPIVCDYWRENSFTVEIDTQRLSVAEGVDKTIGEPTIDTEAVKDSIVTLNGPKAVINKINKVVARINEPTVQSKEIDTYTVSLVALDAAGKEVDISECTIKGLSDKKVDVTVPLWENRQIAVKYTVKGLPEGLDPADYLIVDPAVLDVSGRTEELDEFETKVQKLDIGDITDRSKEKPSVSIPLNTPSTISVAKDITQIKVSLDFENGRVSQREMTLTTTVDSVLAEPKSGGKDYTVSIDKPKNYTITLIGNADSIAAITEDDIKFHIQTDDISKSEHSAYIVIQNYNDVWVQSGYDHSYKVEATLGLPAVANVPIVTE